MIVTALLVFDLVAAEESGSSPNECADPDSEWVFCTSFEEGSLDLWDDYDGNPPETNLLMKDPGPHNLPGNHVCRLRAPAGRGGANLVKVLPGAYDQLYARWYVKWEEGYDFSVSNHGGGLFAGDRNLLGHSGDRPSGDDWFTAWMEIQLQRFYSYVYYRGMYQDCANPNGSCWGDAFPCMIDEGEVYCKKSDHRETRLPPKPVTGRWYCIEMMIDAGTPTSVGMDASGVLNFWVDGVAYGPWTHLWFRTTSDLKLNLFWINMWFHADHSVEGMMVDDVVVSTSRIGARNSTPIEHGPSGNLKGK